MRTILIFFLVIICSSCATILKGSREKVSFIAESGNASVYINGRYLSNTPFYTTLRSNRNYQVVMVRDSLNQQTFYLNRKLKPGYLIADLLLATTIYLSPFIVVDAITGAWFRLDNNVIVFSTK